MTSLLRFGELKIWPRQIFDPGRTIALLSSTRSAEPLDVQYAAEQKNTPKLSSLAYKMRWREHRGMGNVSVFIVCMRRVNMVRSLWFRIRNYRCHWELEQDGRCHCWWREVRYHFFQLNRNFLFFTAVLLLSIRTNIIASIRINSMILLFQVDFSKVVSIIGK